MPTEAADRSGGESLPGPSVLASDLDGTVVSVNTFPRFVAYALWRLVREGHLVCWSRLVLALASRKLLGTSHVALKEVVHDCAEVLQQDAVEAWARRLMSARAHPHVVAMIQGWEGLSVLCTAAPQPYADHFGRLLGVDLVQGSGRHDGEFRENVSVEKARRLRDRLQGTLSSAVTDDAHIDAALLAMADEPWLVGRDGTVRRAPTDQGRSALGPSASG